MFLYVAAVHVLLFTLYLSPLCDGRSHYDVLGIPRTSSSKIITKKYRELAKKLHPDKNKSDPNAQDKFIELSKSYEVLNDAENRRAYDHELKFGRTSQGNPRQFHRGDSNPFQNFHEEEVFMFRTADGRVFTTRTSTQQRQRQQQQQQYYQQQHQQQGFSGEEEMNWNWDFMESSNNAPTTTLGWIGFGFFMFMGMILFMTVSVFSTLFSVFPNLAVFLAVFLVFLVIFSTSIFSCCGSRKKKIIQKEERPKCVVQPRNRQKENERHMFDDIYQQNENDIPIFENNLLGKDRICIVCRTAQSTENSLTLRNKYRKDPLLFCRSEIFLESIYSEETPTDLNVIEKDDNGDVSTKIKSSQLNSNQSHVIAIVGRAVRWAEYSSPYPRNLPENVPNSSSESFLQSNLISQTTSSTVEHSGSSSTEEHSTKNIPQNISGNSDRNNDIDEFDCWLNKLLCGEIMYHKTDLHPLPSLTSDITK